MNLYKNDFVDISINQKQSVINFTWSKKTKSEEMSTEIFKEVLLKEVELVEKHEPKFILINTLEFGFPIVPEVQSWIDEAVYPNWANSGVQKIGLIMSKDFIGQLSVEQAIDENSSEEMISSFFETREEALQWFEN